MQTAETLQNLISQEQQELDSLVQQVDIKRRLIEGLKQSLSACTGVHDASVEPPLTPLAAHSNNGATTPALPIEFGKLMPNLDGMTVNEAVFYVLRQAGKPMYYKDIYDIAVKHGYHSARTERLSLKYQSFYTSPVRRPDVFVRDTGGIIRLTEQAKSLEVMPRKSRRGENISPRANPALEKVKACLADHGPCNRGKIMEVTGLNYGSVGQLLQEPEFVQVEYTIWDLASKNGKKKTAKKKKK